LSKEISNVPAYIAPCDIWDIKAQKEMPDYEFLGEFIRTHAEGEKIHGTALAYALYLGEFYWTKSPPEVGKPFDYDYPAWAQAWSGKRDVSPYIRVGELLYQMRYGLLSIPDKVVLRDAEGEAVTTVDEETQEETPVVVEPNIFSPDVNYTKLLLSKRKAQNPDAGLTEEDWGKLLNPKVTVEQYRQHLLQTPGYGWDHNPGRFRCWEEGPMILCAEGGKTQEYVGVDGLNIQGLEMGDELLLKVHRKVCKALGIISQYTGDF